MERHDIEVICKDCGQSFVITAGEQEWYADNNMALPKRCKDCRNKRKAERDNNRQ